MDKTLIAYKKSYLLVPILIIFGVILMTIDAKFTGRDLAKKDYIKFSLVIGFISTFIVYIHNIKGKVEEEVMTGTPPF